MPEEIHSFEEFRRFLSDTLGVAEEALIPEAHFMYDLGIESLTLVELMLQLEIRLGRDIPLDTAWAIETVGEAYQFYTDQVNHK
jgi:acyl carrier protein